MKIPRPDGASELHANKLTPDQRKELTAFISSLIDDYTADDRNHINDHLSELSQAYQDYTQALNNGEIAVYDGGKVRIKYLTDVAKASKDKHGTVELSLMEMVIITTILAQISGSTLLPKIVEFAINSDKMDDTSLAKMMEMMYLATAVSKLAKATIATVRRETPEEEDEQ